MNNSNKFASLLQLMTIAMIYHLMSSYYVNGSVNEPNFNFNSSSRKLSSLNSITVTTTHTTHFTLTCGIDSHNTTAFNDKWNTTGFTDKRKYRSHGKHTQITLTINLHLNKEMMTATMEMSCDTIA